MVPDEQQRQPTQEARVAADLAALSARVESLERQLAELQTQPSARSPDKPLRRPVPLQLPARKIILPPDFAKQLPKAKGSLEDRIGSQLFSRIGIVALLIATTLFLKWAIDNHWIGPLGRILAGLIAGAAIVDLVGAVPPTRLQRVFLLAEGRRQRSALPLALGGVPALPSAAGRRCPRRNGPCDRMERLHGLVAEQPDSGRLRRGRGFRDPTTARHRRQSRGLPLHLHSGHRHRNRGARPIEILATTFARSVSRDRCLLHRLVRRILRCIST